MLDHDLAFGSVATIRVLLVPVQPIKRDTYAQHCALIRRFSRIALRDVPVDPRGPAAQLSAQPFSRGSVLFDYVDSYNKAQTYLEEFQVSRRLLGVIGICQCDEWDGSLDEARVEFNRILGQHPQALAHRCYAFDPPEDLPDNVEGLVVVPSVGDLNFYISTLLADFTASLLHEMSNLASNLDTRSTVNTPRDPTTSAALRPHTLRRSTLPELPSLTGTNEAIDRTVSATPPSHRAPSRLSTMGADVMAAGDRSTKRKMQSRLLKLKADLRALAGRWDEAQAMYEEAINTFKLTSDDVWLAAALEASIMLALLKMWYNSTPSLNTSTGPNSRPTSAQAPPFAPSALREQLERLEQIVPLYTKALSTDPHAEDHTPPLLYAEACLRSARALYAVWRSSGWSLRAVELMIQPWDQSNLQDTSYAQRTSASLIQRSAIAEQVSLAITSHSLGIPLTDRLALCSAAATLYSSIGYSRKRSSVLREAAALISEAAMHAKTSRQLQASTSSLIRSLPHADGNSSIVQLLHTICADVGIPLTKRHTEKNASPLTVEQDLPEPFGWSELQLSVIKDCILCARMLSDYPAALQLSVSTLKYLAASMVSDEQLHLSRDIAELAAAARRRGLDATLDFWGPQNMVVGLQVHPLDKSRVVQERPISHAVPKAETKLPSNPFIYNPKAKSADDKIVLVQNELVEVLVTLQNPFLFDVEIADLRLSTSGVDFKAQPLTVTLSPGSLHTFRLSGYPLQAGSLAIRGVFLRLSGSVEQEFIVPSFDKPVKGSKTSVVNESERIKHTGLDAFKKLGQSSTPQSAVPKVIECKVAPAQPLLRIDSTSLVHGALMMYDGETTQLEIRVENTSERPVDLCRLSFQDNLSTELADQLLDSETELTPGEAYELDWELRHTTILSWTQQPENFRIEAGEKSTLVIQCHGKYGCMEGLVTIDYASIHHNNSESDTFFARRIQCPIVFTIHRVIDAGQLTLQPLQALRLDRAGTHDMQRNRSLSISSQLDSALEATLYGVERAKHCLLAVTMTNVFNRPFEVTIESTDSLSGDNRFHIKQRVEAASTVNFIARLPRIRLESQDVQKPIPPPQAARQYVVSTSRSQMSSTQQELEREIFWYREAILGMIRASWKEIGARRQGDVRLRNLRITKSMLDVLRAPTITLDITLAGSTTRRVHEELWKASADELIDVSLAVKTQEKIDGLELQLEVFSITPSTSGPSRIAAEFALVEGASTFDLSDCQSVSTRVLFLSSGSFALRTTLYDGSGSMVESKEVAVLVES